MMFKKVLAVTLSAMMAFTTVARANNANVERNDSGVAQAETLDASTTQSKDNSKVDPANGAYGKIYLENDNNKGVVCGIPNNQIAEEGKKITFHVEPKSGYMIYSVKSSGAAITKEDIGTYSFIVPWNYIIITVTYKESATFTDGDFTYDTINYSGECRVSGYKGKSSTVNIPKTATDSATGTTFIVKQIGYWAFGENQNITSVIISNNITSIGSYSFIRCSALTNIEIPENVISIGSGAFSECGFTDLPTLPNNITTISDNLFFRCKALTNVPIPERMTSIGDGAFWDCSGLTSIEIPASVTSIGISAFESCSNLTSIEIPASVTSLSDRVFIGCPSLKAITFADGSQLKTIGEDALYGCSLTGITIPNSVTSIGDGAFLNCRALTSIIIPAGVESIGTKAFKDCTSLKYVLFPSDGTKITSVGSDVFVGTLLAKSGSGAKFYTTQAVWNSYGSKFSVYPGNFVAI